MLQDAVLFRAPVWQNIAYGRPEARRAEIVRAAELANADGFIKEMPDGYDTMVGERGVSLSGGQRQRIAIARAVIRDAPILILDEPTSGLDAQSEQAIMEALERLMKNRTSIVIAHHLGTILHADTIFVMNDHELVEHGTHDELLAAARRLLGAIQDSARRNCDRARARSADDGLNLAGAAGEVSRGHDSDL